MNSSAKERLKRAEKSLQGLSVGDAFGERFFTNPRVVDLMVAERAMPARPWSYTDDTVMAISVVDVLQDCDGIDRDRLADFFATRYQLDTARGYGATAHEVLSRIVAGEHWRDVSPSVFKGQGSKGNGGAMRAAPVGAYFADDLRFVVQAARESAEVTHAHPDGQAGAIAIAVAAAWVAAGGDRPDELFKVVLELTPVGPTRAGLEKAARLPRELDVPSAVSILGNGTQVISEDTVPFALWSAARHLTNFEEAMWSTVAGFGDRDTTCAIVGGIIALHPAVKIPTDWLEARESLTVMSRGLLPERLQRTK